MSQDRKTFTIPNGYEAIRNAEGRATGEVRPTYETLRTLLATSQRELAEARAERDAARIQATERERKAVRRGADFEQRAEAAEARATASERQVEAMARAASAVLASWDAGMPDGHETYKTSEEFGFSYWSPSASMVSSEAMSALRAALQKGNPDA